MYYIRPSPALTIAGPAHRPVVSSVIVATGKVERIAENAAASDGHPLLPEACAWLEELIK